jgi:hypothetical protein
MYLNVGFFLQARLRFLIAMLGIVALTLPSRADHFSGASITYACSSGNTYTIYLDIFLDCSGTAAQPQTLRFRSDCGVAFDLPNLNYSSFTEVSPVCAGQLANTTCNGGTQPGFRKYRYSITLPLSPCDSWTFEWYTCCRNTLENVNLTPGTYVVATLDNSSVLCDDSPVFADSGVPFVCVNQAVSYNPGISDPDGNTLSFALISARYAAPLPAPVTYINGYTETQPIAGMTFNTGNGQMNFTPTSIGYYAVVIEVKSFDSFGSIIGRVMRDLMFVVYACDGSPPISPGITSVTSGISFNPVNFVACGSSQICVNIPFSDPQAAQSLTVTSNATIVLPGSTFSVVGTNPAIATVCWTPNQSVLPVSIWFEATDDACPLANDMSTFITVFSCVFLPVELLEFDAVPNDGAVKVMWATGSELGSAYFVVERSGDGETFTPIGEVAAAGESSSLIRYHFVDDQPLFGTSYYRLRQVDQDGSTAFSRIASVDLGNAEAGLVAQWTPSGWKIDGVQPGWSWDLFDSRGAQLGQGQFHDQSTAMVPTSGSQTGVAVLIVRSPQRSFRFVLPHPSMMGDAPALLQAQ